MSMRKVELRPLPMGTITRPMLLCTGDMPITWNSVEMEQSGQRVTPAWLNDTMPTKVRGGGLDEEADIRYRPCTCWLQCEWCTCPV